MAPGSPVGVLTPQNDSVVSSTVRLHFGHPGRLTPLRQTPMVPDVGAMLIGLILIGVPLLVSYALLVVFFDDIGVFLCLSGSVFQKCMQPTE